MVTRLGIFREPGQGPRSGKNESAEKTMRTTRRAFGRVLERPPRRGYYVRFRWKGREYERAGGPTKACAERILAKAHAALAEGREVTAVMADVFGDASGCGFRKLWPVVSGNSGRFG